MSSGGGRFLRGRGFNRDSAGGWVDNHVLHAGVLDEEKIMMPLVEPGAAT